MCVCMCLYLCMHICISDVCMNAYNLNECLLTVLTLHMYEI